jgi:eukaryotic-like serine/threonine-protein kinase
MSEVLADRYELGRPIGSGGMARVYEAFDRVLHRRVAVKVVRDDLGVGPVERERLLREARSAASFTHANAVAVYDTGEHEGKPFIVMELVEGTDLGEVLQAGPMDPDRVVDIAAQFLAALGAAHASGLVHRDIKPSNILLPDEGGVKLADFGIAKGLQDASATLTATGQIIGTPRYLSPEQVGGQPADPRSDVYASGVVLYEMLAGHPPFDAPTPLAVALAHQRDQPPPLDEARPGLDPHLVAVVDRALDKEPDRRFADAAALRAALVGSAVPGPAAVPTVPLAGAAAAPASATTAVLPPADRSPGRRWQTAAIVGALLLLALVAFAVTRPDGDEVTAPAETPAATEEPEPTEEPAPTEEPEPEPEPEPAEPDSVAALISTLAEDPDAAGEKGEDLFDLLVDVSRTEPDKQPKEARDAIKKIEEWVDKGELAPGPGTLAVRLLEPLAAEDDEGDGQPPARGRDGPPPGQQDRDDD